MIISFDIPTDKATRLGNAMPLVGYVFNPELGTTDVQQKLAFIKRKTIAYWREIVNNYEEDLAKKQAAEEVVVDFDDIQ